ncbi:hypothetical protein MBR_06540, partial [Metarhizium brunneum ARSEF 3297]
MRFSLAAALFLASSALAVPTMSASELSQRSLITQVGNVVLQLEDGVGVTAVEGTLDTLLGGALPKVCLLLVPRPPAACIRLTPLVQLEDALGVTFSEKLLGLSRSGAGPGAVQAVGEAVAMLLQGIGLPQVDAFLDSATGGAMSSLEGALGVTDIEKALHLSGGV